MTVTTTLANGASVTLAFSEIAHGDFAVGSAPDALSAARSGLLEGEWNSLVQVHSATVHRVGTTQIDPTTTGDALVTDRAAAVLSVTTADCVPVLFASSAGVPVVGAAHAGWRGLYEGVIEATIAELRDLGANDIHAWIGPCIGAPHYEFGEADLTTMALRFGPDVIAASEHGTAALDVVRAAKVALANGGVYSVDESLWRCTVCTVDSHGEPALYSHRARSDSGRLAAAIVLRD